MLKNILIKTKSNKDQFEINLIRAKALDLCIKFEKYLKKNKDHKEEIHEINGFLVRIYKNKQSIVANVIEK